MAGPGAKVTEVMTQMGTGLGGAEKRVRQAFEREPRHRRLGRRGNKL
jgi:hypothetical protein